MAAPRGLCIALVHYTIPPVIGGVESVVAAQGKVFKQFGHQAVLFDGQGFRTRFDPASFDLLIAHNVLTMPFDLALTGMIWKLADRMPVINWVHDVAARNADYDIPTEAPFDLLRRAHPRMTQVAISEQRRDLWAGLTGAQVHVIPNGLHVSEALPLTEAVRAFANQHSILARELILFYPTRLIPRKQVERAIEVVASLREDGVDAVLLCRGAGDPHQKATRDCARRLREQIEASGLPEAVWLLQDHFPVADADVAALYQVADALLLTSRQEGFGLPLLEAALHRVPLFCADMEPLRSIGQALDAGQSQAISGEPWGGSYSPDASAAAIGQLLWKNMQSNPAWLRRKTLVKNFSWEAIMARQMEPLLLQSIHG